MSRLPFLVPMVLLGACAHEVNRPAAAAAPVPAAAPAPAAPAGYAKPPEAVLDVLHAPPPPIPMLSPPGATLLLVTVEEYPSIQHVAEPYLKLAGVRVEPRTRRKHDTAGGYGVAPCASDFTLVRTDTGATTRVALPPGGCVEGPLWSPDGKRLAFRNVSASAVELWVADAATGTAHVVPGVKLNPMLGHVVQWTGDGKTLLVKLVEEGSAPAASAVTELSGPSIQETDGRKGESSTYETRDTLRNEHDEHLFDAYATSRLAWVNVETGAVQRMGPAALYDNVDLAPDGQHVLVESIHRPYSYVTTYDRFPHDVAVWDRMGASHPIASLPLADRVPVHGVPTGPRDFEWRSSAPATLVWAEALDGGDWNINVPARDRVLMNAAPFTAPPVEVARLAQRYAGFGWSEQPGTALLQEEDLNRHWRRTFIVNVDAPKASPELLWDQSSDEHYKDPGTPVLRQLPNGAWVLRQEGDAIFLSGMGSTPTGDRPFLDRLHLTSKKSERLFRSEPTAYDRFLGFPGPDSKRLLTWHQSPTDPPNAILRTLGPAHPPERDGEPAFAASSEALTKLPDPTPAVRAIQKRLVRYKRKDGTDLSFTLYTPPGYREGERVPAILYAYPLDFADPSKAGQVTGSEQTFTRLRQYRLLLLAGYAIIDNAAFPIVGDPKRAYDTYLEQLTADAQAAVDKAVAMGVVDPQRIGITGHSHGALMTANLVTHTQLFRAGVATSGSYNKTLTPFGFQNERRSVWEAQGVYLKASPFFYANQEKVPLLIIHGEDDANPGTTPLQAQKLYEAIRGNGGTARLVMLPHEPHWYAAMESNEHLIAEMIRWFDRYVKNAPH